MEVSGDSKVTVDGAKVSFKGGTATVRPGGQFSLGVRGEATDTFTDLLDKAGFRQSAALDLEITATDAPGTRGGPAEEPTVFFEPPPLQDDEQCHVLLVEENGELHWEFQKKRTRHFELAIDPELQASRGALGDITRRAVRFLAVKALEKGTKPAAQWLARQAEKRLRKPRIRTFTRENFHTREAAEPDLETLSRGRALLLVHGTNSAAHEAFATLDAQWVRALCDRYGDRVIAFDHPTLSVTPAENAKWLRDKLRSEDGIEYKLDILAHSRGGLVARELVERIRDDHIEVRSVLFVATPNNGTPLADSEHLGEFVDAFTNLAAVIPDNPLTDALTVVLELVKDVALRGVHASLPGIQSMDPHGEYLAGLNALGRPEGVTYLAIAADFEPLSTHGVLTGLRDRLFDRVFDGAMNDLVVPTRSVYLPNDGFDVSVMHRCALDSSFGVNHSTFWTENVATKLFDQWLRPDWPDDRAAPVDLEYTDPRAEVEAALDRADESALLAAARKLAEIPTKFKEAIDSIAGGPLTHVHGGGARSGTVIVLPGIMGSILDADGDRVWVSVKELRKGGFARLSLGQGGGQVRAVGLNKVYGSLATRLAENWDVHLFPYDWRGDVFESADHLAAFVENEVWRDDPRPLHLVAHSMGGLVARAFIASHPKLWKKMDSPGHEEGGRLIMLGTPNRGSYAIPLAFLGDELLVKGLAAVDQRLDRNGIVSVMTTFPGCYQMLPAPALDIEDDHARLYAQSTWSGTPIVSELLERAQQTHEDLEDVVDPERFVYVAGDLVQTPARVRIDRGKFHFGTHDRGDGRVTHASGKLPEVPIYYVQASHGALVTDPRVLGSLDDLLRSGRPADDALGAEPAPRRGAEGDEFSPLVPAAAVDPDPDWPVTSRGGADVKRRSRAQIERALDDATRHYLGGPSSRPQDRPSLRVRVIHASLEQVDHPVVVGHYRGIPPEGAEGVVDFRLDGALAKHRHLGDYPEASGDVLLVEAPCERPPGALVVGLGEFGSLTGSQLRRTVMRAAIRRTLRAAENHVCTEGASPTRVGIAAVLVGTPGRFGLTVESSVRALVEGTALAVDELSRTDGIMDKARLEELQIVELYEERAVHAAEVVRDLRNLLPPHIEARVDLRLPERLEARRGGRPGLPSRNASGDPWARIEIEEVEEHETREGKEAALRSRDQRPTLRFTSLGRGAQVDRLELSYDPAKVSALIEESVRRPDATDQALTLFELLFPQDIKLELDDADSLRLLLDDHTAAIPWELLAGRNDLKDGRALALRTGMLRQLRPSYGKRQVRKRYLKPDIDSVLVVGDPPAGHGLPRLPGARREASEVAGLLRRNHCDVTDLVFGPEEAPGSWVEIQSALVRRPYQVIHFATHGEVVDDDPRRTGLVVGWRETDKPPQAAEQPRQTGERVYLTALDFEQMSFTPDMVFLNACHVGRVPGAWDQPARSDANVHELAANLALTLMQNGVKAVVAAGWAVDDAAARTFASTLYGAMLEGRGFGEAVRRARKETFRIDGGRTNTWGAYQCYGDPGFQLRPRTRVPRGTTSPVSAGGLLSRIINKKQDAETAGSEEHIRKLLDDVHALDESCRSSFCSPEVHAEFGRAYAELGAYEDAVWAYRKAAGAALEGELPLSVVEQLANMESRLAARPRDEKRGKALHSVQDTPDRLFTSAVDRIRTLLDLEKTGERYALKGSVFKKKARSSEGTHRRSAVAEARKAYEKAFNTSSKDKEILDPYHTTLALQMRALGQVALAKEHADLVKRLREQVERAREGELHKATPLDFWTDAALGDVTVTEAVLYARSDDTTKRMFRERTFMDAVEPYKAAFENRSTVRERDSVLDHLRDLAALMEEKKDEIERLIGALEDSACAHR